jgi:hypothetical protein
MTNEELNARFAAVAELLSDFAGEHDITLKRLEEGIDELRNEQRRVTGNLDELRSIVRTAVRAGVRERRERHQAEKELRAQLLEIELRGQQRHAQFQTELEESRKRFEAMMAETESRNEHRLSRMEAAIERLANLMAEKNGSRD